MSSLTSHLPRASCKVCPEGPYEYPLCAPSLAPWANTAPPFSEITQGCCNHCPEATSTVLFRVLQIPYPYEKLIESSMPSFNCLPSTELFSMLHSWIRCSFFSWSCFRSTADSWLREPTRALAQSLVFPQITSSTEVKAYDAPGLKKPQRAE